MDDVRIHDGVILRLDVSKWSGSAQLEADDLGLSAADVQATFALGRKRLISKDAFERLDGVHARARYLLETLSHRLPDGSRFILAQTAPEVLSRLQAMQTEFFRERDALLDAYPEWQARMEPTWRDAAEQAFATQAARATGLGRNAFIDAFMERVALAYPSRDTLAAKYDFIWLTFTLRLGGFRAVDIAVTAAEEEQRRAQDAAYEAQVRARINAALESSIGQLHASIADAFGTVLEHVRSGKPVREGSLDRLRRTISRFRALNIFGADSVETAIREFEDQTLAPLSNGRSITDLGDVFAAGLAGVVQAATARGAAVSGLSGRLRRSFGAFANDETIDGDPDVTEAVTEDARIPTAPVANLASTAA